MSSSQVTSNTIKWSRGLTTANEDRLLDRGGVGIL